jgi:hypothetical protein
MQRPSRYLVGARLATHGWGVRSLERCAHGSPACVLALTRLKRGMPRPHYAFGRRSFKQECRSSRLDMATLQPIQTRSNEYSTRKVEAFQMSISDATPALRGGVPRKLMCRQNLSGARVPRPFILLHFPYPSRGKRPGLHSCQTPEVCANFHCRWCEGWVLRDGESVQKKVALREQSATLLLVDAHRVVASK